MSLAPIPSAPGWQRIDEVTLDLSDYVYLISAAGGWCFYTLSSPSVLKAGDIINSLSVSGYWKSSSGTLIAAGNTGLYIGTTRYEGTAFNVTTTNTLNTKTWTTNPATGNAWTYEEVTAIQAGVYCKGNGSTSCYCYLSWVSIDFTTPTGCVKQMIYQLGVME